MNQKFVYLEWKAFIRSVSFGTNLALKFFWVFMAILYVFILLWVGIGAFYSLKNTPKIQCTMLASSHDLQHRVEVYDRILVLNKGEVAKDIPTSRETCRNWKRFLPFKFRYFKKKRTFTSHYTKMRF